VFERIKIASDSRAVTLPAWTVQKRMGVYVSQRQESKNARNRESPGRPCEDSPQFAFAAKCPSMWKVSRREPERDDQQSPYPHAVWWKEVQQAVHAGPRRKIWSTLFSRLRKRNYRKYDI